MSRKFSRDVYEMYQDFKMEREACKSFNIRQNGRYLRSQWDCLWEIGSIDCKGKGVYIHATQSKPYTFKQLRDFGRNVKKFVDITGREKI